VNFSPNNIYHIYNQGNNRQPIFTQRADYLIFLSILKKLFPGVCSTLAWCLMPNHFHFMVHTDERCSIKIKQGGLYIDPITNGIRKLLSGYTRVFNNLYNRSGSLFRQKTKAKSLSAIEIKLGSSHCIQDYYVNCFHYIHQNPLVAKLVTRMEDWEFSSFQDYAGFRNGTLCDKDLARIHCNYSVENFIETSYKFVEEKFINHFT